MLLQAEKISKSYGTIAVLTDIYLQIKERERIGLVGVNGAGKSTLLQILAGQLSYDSGQIHRSKETIIGYLKQNSGLSGEQSIWNEMLSVFSHLLQIEQELRDLEHQMADPAIYNDEARFQQTMNRYDRLSETFRQQNGYEIETKIRGVLHGMGFGAISFDTPIEHLSGGQKTRLALAKLLLSEPDLLLLDEPTNHLDLETLSWLEDYLISYPGAILVVSHDRYFLDAIVQTIYEIERTKATRYTGNYTRFIDLKAAEFESKMKQYEKQQMDISAMEEFVQRNIARASTSNRAKSRRKALDRMERIDRPKGTLRKAQFRFEVERMSGKKVLETKNLSFAHPNDPPLFDQLELQLTRGESVALIGPNGSGKTSLLKTLTGTLTPQHGIVDWGANVKVAYYDQEQDDLTPENTIIDELWNEYPELDEVKIRTVLGNFLFSGEDVLKKIASLSGGEKARVSLAKLMLQEANVLLLDEPTNHLDLYSKEVLETALIDYEGTLLFISHDRYFLNRLAEEIWEMSVDGIHHFLGNFDDYVEKKKEMAEIEAERLEKEMALHPQKTTEKNNSADLDYEQRKMKRQAKQREQRRREQLELEIEQIEAEIQTLEAKLSVPEISQDYEQLQEISEQIESKQNQLEPLFAEWESLL